jgi:hypothetical protein
VFKYTLNTGNVVGSKATSRARGSSIVVASCSVIVDDMTKHTHATGQECEDKLLRGGLIETGCWLTEHAELELEPKQRTGASTRS